MHVCMYVCMYVCMCVYIYIYIYREREMSLTQKHLKHKLSTFSNHRVHAFIN